MTFRSFNTDPIIHRSEVHIVLLWWIWISSIDKNSDFIGYLSTGGYISKDTRNPVYILLLLFCVGPKHISFIVVHKSGISLKL